MAWLTKVVGDVNQDTEGHHQPTTADVSRMNIQYSVKIPRRQPSEISILQRVCQKEDKFLVPRILRLLREVTDGPFRPSIPGDGELELVSYVKNSGAIVLSCTPPYCESADVLYNAQAALPCVLPLPSIIMYFYK